MEYIASLSYGKDSIYMLEIIHQNKLPLDRIVHAEIWATDEINADLPPMVEFKKRTKSIIESRYGIEVEHVRSEWTYESLFYSKYNKGKKVGEIYGFPLKMSKCPHCRSRLKLGALSKIKGYEYVGYAIDEPNLNRQKIIQQYLKDKNKSRKLSPLIDYGITEQEAMDWCKNNNLLSPVYKTSARGGCWFCHVQPMNELRLLRKNYPKYWELMLKWDKDSPVKWDAVRTLHDYDKRFQMEEEGLVPTDRTFRWKMIDR